MNLVPSESMRRWDAMFARWAEVSRLVEPAILKMVGDDLMADLMAEVEQRPAHPLGPFSISISDSGWDFFTRNTVAVLVDVYALDLLTPDPVPDIIPLPRLHRLGNLYRKARNAWLSSRP